MKSQLRYLLLLILFSTPLLAEAKVFWHSPYKSPICPLKPDAIRLTEQEWCTIYESVDQAVLKEGLSDSIGYENALSIMLGLIQKESSFRVSAIGKAGEIGLTQIMPSTGRFICGMNNHDLFDINNNVTCSAKYLNLLLSKDYFDKDINSALIAYNQGWGNVKKGLFYENDIRYANLILREYSPRFYQLASVEQSKR